MEQRRYILPVIVLSQFCCTTLWFASNAVISDLTLSFHLPYGAISHLTSAVQFGFISGTLFFAVLTISDRYPPSRVFFICALIGAILNACMLIETNNFWTLFGLRMLTGFSLAGIYPVGMKIASDYYKKGLGKSLGFLVGALVLGTAFPHLLKGFENSISWSYIIICTSLLALSGGSLLMILVPTGPYHTPGQKIDLSAFIRVFRNRNFRSAAFGYFGHMWELYAFWAFVPVMLTTFSNLHPGVQFNVPLASFFIIGLGSIACVIGGFMADIKGERMVAATALFLSGICCLISPLVFLSGSGILMIAFMIFWGLVVIADSPLFSTLVAHNAPQEMKGTALTIVNCIGFSITIISIQLIHLFNTGQQSIIVYTLLVSGPIFGLFFLIFKK